MTEAWQRYEQAREHYAELYAVAAPGSGKRRDVARAALDDAVRALVDAAPQWRTTEHE